MSKGIYFLDKNVSLLSDIESFFVVNNMVTFIGGAGLLQEAQRELQGREDVDVIVITDNLVDAGCLDAYKALRKYPARKILALRNPNEAGIRNIEEQVVVISYPFSCNTIEETIKRMWDAHAYDEIDLKRIAESNIEGDNPFLDSPFQKAQHMSEEPKSKRDDIPVVKRKGTSYQERLKHCQINRNKNRETKLFPQRVIAIHSQKGGVGKSTVSRELAIAIQTARIERDTVEYVPKVCLCDFDFEAADLSALMGIEPNVNIMNWCDDIEYESGKTGNSMDSIRFTEEAILERYLVQHESGVYLLAAPDSKTDCFKIQKEHIISIIENLKLCDFDIIMLDTGPNILDYTLMSLSLCTDIFAVCNSDMLSSKRLDGMISDVFSRIPGFDFGKIKLIVNKINEKSSVTARDIANVLNLELIGEIPYFPDIVDINNDGRSIFFNRKKPSGTGGDYANAFRGLARNLVCSSADNQNFGTQNAVAGIDSLHKRGNFGVFRK